MTWSQKNPALAKAQELMRDALDTASTEKRIKLAKEALSICPDCADAYVVLAADISCTRQQRIGLLEEGMKAGQRVLGPKYFKEEVGCFWGILETRPYMRARFGLAVELQNSGLIEVAIAHYKAILRLNGHSDNQGVRYQLAPLYVSLHRLTEAEKLIKKYPDEVGPNLNFSHALMLFKQGGDSQKARTVLQEAARWNTHVLSYLLTPKLKAKARTYDHITCGGKAEP